MASGHGEQRIPGARAIEITGNIRATVTRVLELPDADGMAVPAAKADTR